MTSTPKLISTKETCELLQISRATLTRWVQAGKTKEAAKGEGIRGERFFYRTDVVRLKKQLDSKKVAA